MGVWEDIQQMGAAQQAANAAIEQWLDPYKKKWEGWRKGVQDYVQRTPGLKQMSQASDWLSNVLQTPGMEYALPMGGPVGYLAKNYRTAEQIQALRKLMAQEMKARGPVQTIGKVADTQMFPASELAPMPETAVNYKNYDPAKIAEFREWAAKGRTTNYPYDIVAQLPNPRERLLRGSFWHGASESEREHARQVLEHMQGQRTALKSEDDVIKHLMGMSSRDVGRLIHDYDPMLISSVQWQHVPYEQKLRMIVNDIAHSGELPDFVRHITAPMPGSVQTAPVQRLYNTGFMGSSHSGQGSISDHWGEPYGVSLSAKASKAGEFAGNPNYIHRVLPLYGGNPVERTVDLTTIPGQRQLHNAYDQVLNRMVQQEGSGLARSLAENAQMAVDNAYHLRMGGSYGQKQGQLNDYLASTFESHPMTGEFNTQLSKQLIDEGKRAVLYHPYRYNEYELLMLDPKYALPLDYRMPHKYTETGRHAIAGQGGITPGAWKGINDIIYGSSGQNALPTNLANIYKQRPMTQRLSPDNVRKILDMVEHEYGYPSRGAIQDLF